MYCREKDFADELERALHWLNNNDKRWQHIINAIGWLPTDDEFSEAVNILVNEKQYIPLLILLASEFVHIDTEGVLRKILVTILVSRWDDRIWDIIVDTTKQTISEYLKERGQINTNGTGLVD